MQTEVASTTTTPIQAIHEYLSAMREIHRARPNGFARGAHYQGMEDFVLQHGGHNADRFSQLSTGRGLVFETRRALDYSLTKMAGELGCSVKQVCKCEARGALPNEKRSIAVRAALLRLMRRVVNPSPAMMDFIETETAKLRGIYEGGVFL